MVIQTDYQTYVARIVTDVERLSRVGLVILMRVSVIRFLSPMLRIFGK